MSLLDSLPSNAGPARDQWTLDAVAQNAATATFVPITISEGGHEGTFYVSADALKVEGVRITMNAKTQQQVADMLQACLLTSKLADQMWLQRGITLKPMPRQITSTTKAMIDQSRKIDAALEAQGQPTDPEVIIATVGKDWLIDEDLVKYPGKAMNYGWPQEDPKRTRHSMGKLAGSLGGITGYPTDGDLLGVSVIQPSATAHDPSHVDYSQNARFVLWFCIVDGVERDVRDILRDPELATLISYTGALSIVRQPGVPEVAPLSPDGPLGGLLDKDGEPAQGEDKGPSTVAKVLGVLAGMGVVFGVAALASD